MVHDAVSLDSKSNIWMGNIINRFLSPLGMRLTRQPINVNPYFHDLATSYVLSEELRQVFVEELAELALGTLRTLPTFSSISQSTVYAQVSAFLELYEKKPSVFDDNRGGSGFDNSFWIYLITRCLKPALIIESGVWQGQTSWLFETAHPDAEIHGFDISLSNLKQEARSVHFQEADWTHSDLRVKSGESGLCFFDCHVSHAERLRQAAERGFQFVLLDDNVPAHLVHAFSSPPLPSLEMILNGGFNEGDEIKWQFRGNIKKYRFSKYDFEGVSDLVEAYLVLPDIGTRTRYGRYSFLTYVKLRIT